ncbi:MAG: ATP-binding protein [Lachnospiraceae bacterium]|nr:ATP-binding protein [Lachnospiraceae bacterium]
MSAVILSYILFGLAIITAITSVKVISRKGEKGRIDYAIFATCICSSWWSFFWAMLFAQTDTTIAWLMRTIGMIGVFAFLICVTYIVVLWSGLSGLWKKCVLGFAGLGVFIYPLNIQPENSIFYLTKFGMSYEFESGLGSNLYSLYCVGIILNLALMLIYMRRNAVRRRERVLSSDLLLCTAVVGFGSVLDTLMPMFGFTAFPGSTLSQALGALVMYEAYNFYNKSRITLSNISKFIYYSVDEPILLFDEKEKLCIVNNGTAVFLERTPEECCKLSINDIFELNKNIFRLRGNKNRVEARCILNQSICSLAIDKIYDEFQDIMGYIIIVHDMTERIHTMQRLEEEKMRADSANQAKSRFLANMSHEIRTPINAVMGMNEIILRESEETETVECARNIRDASKTLLALINDILDFSKIESGMLEVVEEAYSVKNLLTNLYTECQIKTEDKGLYLQFEIPEDMPSILCGDEVRVRQILLNILSNAIKYTQKGGVTLSVRCVSVGEKQVELTAAVSDTGIGIKKENMDKLFGAFDRVDEERVHAIEGTGLGLSIVKRLLELMHGEIKVESEYGKGSVFSVAFRQRVINASPIGSWKAGAEAGRKKEKYEPSFQAPEGRILVVDDNKVNLTVIKGLLKKTNMQITCVGSGRECLEITRKEAFHIILLDHMMPEMDGIETLEKLKAEEENLCRDAAVIVLTANAIAGMREMYLEKGFTDYISKPVDGSTLEKILKQYLPAELVKQKS